MRTPDAPRKQFRLLGGAPLLVQTLRAFERHPEVETIVVVGPPQGYEALADTLGRYGLGKVRRVVAGGATRQASVGEGLAAVPEGTGVVLVHDAVRPFLPADRLSAVIAAARETGAAALAVPVADTLRQAEEESFGATVPREGLWRMQTPQAFHAEVLREAHARFGEVDGTDEVELVRRLGRAVRVVEGSSFNVKITTPADWELAEALWPYWASLQEK